MFSPWQVLVYLVREGEVKQICFFLAQHAVESCLISKNLGDVAKLLANIQKKWLKFCLEKLKSLKDRNIYKVIDLPVKHGSHLIIWDSGGHLRSLKLVSYILSENIENRLGRSSTSAYMLCLYKLHRLHILD